MFSMIRSKKGFTLSRGFTLVEIMIVVAIIALLAAIAIPNLLRARHNANETASIGAMRTLSTALESFRASGTSATGAGISTTGPTYPLTLGVLGTVTPAYAPVSLTGPAAQAPPGRQGYWYGYVFGGNNAFSLQSHPSTQGTTGSRHFWVDQTGVLRQNLNASAGPTSPEVQ